MEIIDLIDKNLIEPNFSAKSKEEVLKKISKIAVKSNYLKNFTEQLVFDKLLEREKMGSTGFADGIAMPHARIDGLEEFVVVIAIAPKGIEYESLDNKKTTIFCTIIAPEEKINEHLKMLATFSRLLTEPNFKKEILQTKDKSLLYEIVYRYISGKNKKSSNNQKMKMMIIILYLEEMLYDILQFLIENEIEGATIIESSGMGSYISNIPLFASFLGFMKEDRNKSKTIISLIPADMEEPLIAGIEKITGDLNKKQGAMIMTFDISLYKGTMEML